MTILELINGIENKFPVDKWAVRGYNVWPIIRIKLAFLYRAKLEKLYSAPGETGTASQKVNPLLSKIQKIIDWENRSIKHKIDRYKLKKSFKRKDALVFFTFSTNRMLQDAVWHNRSVDPIVDLLKADLPVVLLEHTGLSKGRCPRYNDRYCTEVDKMIETMHYTPVIDEQEVSLEGYQSFLKYLKETLPDLESIGQLTEENIIKSVRYFDSLVGFFTEIIHGSGVKAIFTTCYYDIRSMALITACKKLNIPTIELPHGIHGEDHFAYGKWSKLPASGSQMLPDFFWSWGDLEKKAIDDWSGKVANRHKAIVGGNPWLNEWKGDKHPLAQKYQQVIQEKWGNSVKILVSLAPLNEFENVVPDSFINAIKEGPEDWQWLFRLHPRQPQSIEEIERRLKELVPDRKVNVKEATEFPLPALLKGIDTHLTFYSSIVIEAASFGIPSVVFEKGFTIYREMVFPEMLLNADETGHSIIVNVNKAISQKQPEVVLGKSQKEYLAAINLILEKAGISFRVK